MPVKVDKRILGGNSPDRVAKTPDFKAQLRLLTDNDEAYWDYTAVKQNSNNQAYFQYPAMMVPRMQGDIIGVIKKCFPQTSCTLDPFAGSGTILVESLKQNLNSVAMDINPMAILLCKVKCQRFRVEEAEAALREVMSIVGRSRLQTVFLQYKNSQKWFCREALLELSKVRRAILKVTEGDIELRRLLWVAFAEAVRLASNSRTSTYKLHIRDSDDIDRRAVGAKQRIHESMAKVLKMYRANYSELSSNGLIANGSFSRTGSVHYHDVRNEFKGIKADALISSPPYGDNHTTVTYGQHSFLPLSWIPLRDIDESLGEELLANTHTIDSASLGGKRQGYASKKDSLCDKSASLKKLIDNKSIVPDAKQRLIYFFYDLDLGLCNAIAPLRPDSPIVLTLGNRCVSRHKVPMDNIVQELLEEIGCSFVDTHTRSIPTKRMAHRNGSAETMLTETLLVMRSSPK